MTLDYGVGSSRVRAAMERAREHNLVSRIYLAASAALFVASCGNNEADETVAADPVANEESASETAEAPDAEVDALAAENLAASTAFLEENAGRDGVNVTESGLQYMVIEEGPEGGLQPESTDIVQVHYVGTLKDGVEFDSSRARGAAATFPLNRVITGWTEGVQLMSEGDHFRFFLPPDLAYGESGTPGGPIGPNQALIFDVELIKVQNPERNLKAAQDFLAENASKEGVVSTDSGLQYQVISRGEEGGASPDEDDVVKVHYVGTLINGTEFDSSIARGQPAAFPLNRVIDGWTEGVQLMSVGDKFRLFVPPELGYGERGSDSIGPNEALIFEVELLDVTQRDEVASDPE